MGHHRTAPAHPPVLRPVATGHATTRRDWLKLAWCSLGVAGAGLLASSVRFLFPNVLFGAAPTLSIGRPEEYHLGIDSRWLSRFGILVVREPGTLYVLFAECTHLGCLVTWFADERKFKCPCHGSGFGADGRNLDGPAPRPLDRAPVALAGDGQIVVDTTRKLGWDQRHQQDAHVAV